VTEEAPTPVSPGAYLSRSVWENSPSPCGLVRTTLTRARQRSIVPDDSLEAGVAPAGMRRWNLRNVATERASAYIPFFGPCPICRPIWRIIFRFEPKPFIMPFVAS
jgi:hypothetical protein